MVAFLSSATGTQTPNTDGTTVTVTKPASLASGHFMVAVAHGYLPASLTAPSGWVLVAGPIADGTALYSWMYTKVAGGSEPADYTWTWSGSGGTLGVSISAFSGCSGLDNWNVDVTTTDDPSFGPDVSAQQTALGYHVLAWRDSTSNTATATGSVTERFDFTAKDAGVIWRGQAGYTDTATTAAANSINAISIDVTNSIERGIHWSMSLGDAVTNESWSSTGMTVEMDISDTWTDITDDIRYEQGISITRGQSSEAGSPDVSRATLMLDNRSGNYSPRNPNGAYYGEIGRNTPIRICKNQGTQCFETLGYSTDTMRFQTEDKVSLGITGDIDVRMDIEPRSWHATTHLMSKSAPTDGIRQWYFLILSSGKLGFWWTTDGFTWIQVYSDTPVPLNVKRQSVRATLDVNNGSGGYTVTFYYADSIDGSYTTIDSTVTTAGTTSIYAALPVPLSIGQESLDSSGEPGVDPFHGKIYKAQVRSGIAGAIVAEADFTAQSQGTKTFTDSYSNTWIGYADAVVSNRKYRFYGEVSAWPQRWDTTGNDVYVPMEAAGIRRRLESTETPLKSAVTRDMSNRTDMVAYWPCEDGTGSTNIASALANGFPMRVVGSPTFAADSTIKGSDPVLQLNSASTVGLVPAYDPDFEQIALRFFIKIDSTLATLQDICTLTTSGTARQWTLGATGPGDLYLIMVDVDNNSTTDVLASLTSLDTLSSGILTVTLELSQNGADVDYSVIITNFSGADYLTSATVLTDTGTMAGVTIGRATKVAFHPFLLNTAIGHVAVGRALTVFTNTATAMGGEQGEVTLGRFSRILNEEGIASDYVGSTSTTRLGIQRSQTLSDLLRECAATERGVFYEPREFLGLGIHTLRSLQNQPVQLALDYSAFHLAGDLWPDEDDQLIKNDVTVVREGGSKARLEKTSGTLSVAAPPNGVGRYDVSETLSLYQDDYCEDQAGWALHLGTVDEARYPKVEIALENLRFSASSSLTEDALNTDLGHRITIENPPAWIPPEDISLLVTGYTEVFDQFMHNIQFACVPESPYRVAFAEFAPTSGDTTSFRAGGPNSSLSASATSVATSLSVATTTGSALWSTTAADFDIMVSGERMTVTAVSGASSPQTFTVTRSVNGVVKAQTSGSEVKLFQPSIVAL